MLVVFLGVCVDDSILDVELLGCVFLAAHVEVAGVGCVGIGGVHVTG